MIHSSTWGHDTLFFILRVSVPCFYAISGYFLYAADAGREILKAKRWCRKVILLYVSLFFLYAIFGYGCSGDFVPWKVYLFGFATGIYPAIHLWYLNSMWLALTLFCVLQRLGWWNIITVFAALLIGSLFSVWGIMELPVSPEAWRFFRPLWALALMGGGYYAAKYELHRLNASVFILLVIGGLGAAYLYYPEREMFSPGITFAPAILFRCCYLLVALSLLCLCVKYPHFSIPCVARIGKYHSANIYYYHMMVKCCLTALLVILFGINIEGFDAPLTFALSWLLSVVVCRMLTCVREWYSAWQK